MLFGRIVERWLIIPTMNIRNLGLPGLCGEGRLQLENGVKKLHVKGVNDRIPLMMS